MLAEFKNFVMRGSVLESCSGGDPGGRVREDCDLAGERCADAGDRPRLGKGDFSNLFISLNGQGFPTLADAKKAAAPTLNYGVFMNTAIEFLSSRWSSSW